MMYRDSSLQERQANGWKNPYAGRFRWWYPAIADWLISHPDGTIAECAAALGRGVSTIGAITTTDIFRDYLTQRRKEWEARHDHSLQRKLGAVASLSLDILLEGLEKKRDTVPMKDIAAIANTTLERLGYTTAQQPTVQVNTVGGATQVVIPVTASALEEARSAMRIAQSRRASTPLVSHDAIPEGRGLAQDYLNELAPSNADGRNTTRSASKTIEHEEDDSNGPVAISDL